MKKGMALCAGILRLLLAVSPASGADAALPPDDGTHIPARGPSGIKPESVGCERGGT